MSTDESYCSVSLSVSLFSFFFLDFISEHLKHLLSRLSEESYFKFAVFKMLCCVQKKKKKPQKLQRDCVSEMGI